MPNGEHEQPESARGGSSVWTHEPLPYVVVLRMVVDEDRPGESRECHVVAYSLLEAAMQAIYELDGKASPDGTKYKVERIGPDASAYFAALVANPRSATKGRP